MAARDHGIRQAARDLEDGARVKEKSRLKRDGMADKLAPHGERRPVAYANEKFLTSPDARGLRILAEFLEPLSHFRRENIRDTVVFFGSARIREGDGPLAKYYNDARTLARILTEWTVQFTNTSHRFVVCSGGGPGIMEAANRGAADAGGKTVGLNIGLPFEQYPNPYITPELSFEFHYFFMRKFWFAYLAKALVVFPGGFGTLDEMMEILTLTQTRKLAKRMTILLYGSEYWKEVINFDALVKYGTIAEDDLKLFQFVDDPEAAFEALKPGLTEYAMQSDTPEVPAIAKTANPVLPGGTAPSGVGP
jgi:uncharacterized protein (TIGR00730 family)